jgi:hypothetical protein
MFHMCLPEAAKRLGVSETTLKPACRKLGLSRQKMEMSYHATVNTRRMACSVETKNGLDPEEKKTL